MLENIIELILESAEGAFLDVGVFVGAVLLLFGYINYKKSGAFILSIENAKKWQPILGGFLGLTPGCGGAIFIMPLFFKGTVTFGTVVSTLVATMGDSAFVLIASQPSAYILVSILSLLVGIITGYIVDHTSLGDQILAKYHQKRKIKGEFNHLHQKEEHILQHHKCNSVHGCPLNEIAHVGHGEGDHIDMVLHHQLKGHQQPGTIGYYFTHEGFYVYWSFIAVGLILGLLLLFQVDVNALFIPNLGLIIGVTGTFLSIFMMFMGKKFLGDDTHEETELKSMSLRETLVHNAQETAFVITWVFIGFLAYEFLVLALGGGNYEAGESLIESFLFTAGIASVLLGAAIGLIPGCGPQIIFIALFTRGLIPFAALFANAVSQDGDALLPLMAIDRRSALWATFITTVPAIIFGLIIYWFEINIPIGTLLLGSIDYLKNLFLI